MVGFRATSYETDDRHFDTSSLTLTVTQSPACSLIAFSGSFAMAGSIKLLIFSFIFNRSKQEAKRETSTHGADNLPPRLFFARDIHFAYISYFTRFNFFILLETYFQNELC